MKARASLLRVIIMTGTIGLTIGCSVEQFNGNAEFKKRAAQQAPEEGPLQPADGSDLQPTKTSIADPGQDLPDEGIYEEGQKPYEKEDSESLVTGQSDEGGQDPDILLEDGNGDGGLPGIDITDGDGSGLRALCQSKVKKQLSKTLNFPKMEGCVFNTNDKNKERNRYIRAMEENPAEAIQIPENAVLCDLMIGSDTPQMQYDDTLTLTLEDQILFSSVDNFDNLDRTKLNAYDFDNFYDKVFDDQQPYCFGNDCTIPETDEWQDFSYKLPPKSAAQIASFLKGKTSLTFKAITTGDNDSVDCRHTAFDLNVTLNWIEM